jgi:hypothetical protein
VRTGILILLAAALAVAEDDAQLARSVEALVRDLGSPSTEKRMRARFQLSQYGEKVRTLLEQVESDDPEVRRTLRLILHVPGTTEMEILSRFEKPLPIGAPLEIDVRILNNTEQTLALLPQVARQGVSGPFHLRINGKNLVPVGFDQVDWGDEVPQIRPGTSHRFRLSLGRESSPLRRPALYDISVVFQGAVARSYGIAQEDDPDTAPLALETAPVRIHVTGRKVEELEKALSSEDARERESAVAELSAREDEAVTPLLRRHVREQPLRLAAVRQIGALGDKDDLKLILDATSDEDARVRHAAVQALANYAGFKALFRLKQLASDRELQSDAIRALAAHKHHATIDIYLKLLESGGCSGRDTDFIASTLTKWTEIPVDTRASELAFFRGWWEKNARDWAAKNDQR